MNRRELIAGGSAAALLAAWPARALENYPVRESDILHAGVVYRWRENLAFGVGYRRFNISLTSNDAGDTGAFELDNSGPQAFVRMSF